MNLFDAQYQKIMESLTPLVLEDEEPISSSLYGRAFKRILNDEEFRTDSTGKKVKIPMGYSYRQGDDGVGIAVPPGEQVKADRRGRLHAVPKGCLFKIGKNGKGLVVAPGEVTHETAEGQLETLKQLSRRRV